MTDADQKPENVKTGERIAKYLARAGICSRRDAERLIAEGRVTLNGETLQSPAVNVTVADAITVDGAAVGQKEPTRLWRYHKPAGLVTSHKDEQGRETLFDQLPDYLPRVVSVGRLDLNSEGLLLLTNDGSLARHLELPATGWTRKYRVRAFGRIDQKRLDRLQKGITIDGLQYGAITAVLDTARADGKGGVTNHWIDMTLREGKNREIRKVLGHLGMEVNRLIRLSYGPFHLSSLQPGEVEEVPPHAMHAALGGYFNEQK